METLSFFISALFLFAASIHDLRTREVPDLLSYGFILFSIAYGIVRAMLFSSWQPLFQMLGGALAMLFLGLLFFYTGQWGGADSKLLIGVGALLGLGFGSWDALFFLIFLLFGGAVYGLAYVAFLILKHWRPFRKEFLKLVREPHIRRYRILVLLLSFLLLLFSLSLEGFSRFLLALLVILFYTLFYAWLIVKAVEESILIKQYPVTRLTEGDWVHEEVWVEKKQRVPLLLHLQRAMKREFEEARKHDLLLRLLQHCHLPLMRKREVSLKQKCKRNADIERAGEESIFLYAKNPFQRVMRSILFSRLKKSKEYDIYRSSVRALLHARSRREYEKQKEALKKYQPLVDAVLSEVYRFRWGAEYVCGPKDLGISKKQILLLRKGKVQRVVVKEGIPFVPSFLLALLLLWVFHAQLTTLFPSLFFL